MTELFEADLATTTVSSGGTGAPASGTQETWTVASSSMFGAASTGVSQFHVADAATGKNTEIIAVTNVSGTTWTVTRGAESTTPVAHAAGFTVYQVVTAGWLASVGTGGGGAVSSVFGRTGAVAAEPGDYTASEVGALPALTKFIVPSPTGATAADTPAVEAVISALNTAGGNGTLLFQDGIYQVDSNSLVIRSCSNFAVRGTGATVIEQAPNRSGLVNNTSGDLFVIADSTDFRVEGITLDGLRDTLSPLTPLTASSGQASVTVASGAAASYLVGQRLQVNGGIGSSDSAKFDSGSGGHGLVISSITPGGGIGGGDLITFTTNLSNSYTQISSTLLTDGFGPYACAGAFVTPYETGNATVAGRALGGEDQQNGLHLLSCQRFTVQRVTARNLWESPVKCGSGYEVTTLTDGCSQGIIADCTGYHGYDQGISLWVCQEMTVTGCVMNATGWAGICLTQSDYSTVTGNVIISPAYSVFGDNNGGSGIVTEGGLRNQFTGNVIMSPLADGIRVTNSPLQLSAATCPTLSTYLAASTAAGTSVQISATANLTAGWGYSICDGSKTEAVTVATIVDGTHVTLAGNTKFSHASGTYLTSRIGQENVIEGNTVYSPQLLCGIQIAASVRTVVKNNSVSNWALTPGGAGGPSGVSAQYTNNNSWASKALPSGVYVAGYGAVIEGNVLGGGAGPAISLDSTEGISVRGNRCYGAYGSFNVISALGAVNCAIEGNQISDSETSSGINIAAGTLSGTVPSHLTITGNVIARCLGNGIRISSGTAFTVTGNVVTSCGSTGPSGIFLHGLQRSVISGNTCVSNNGAGVQLADNGAVYNQYLIINGNICRDDGTGANISTGATWTQAYGIEETGTSNYNLITGNQCDGNATAQITTVGAQTYAWNNTLSGTVTAGFAPAQQYYAPAGLTGATAASRYVGATASGAPASGTFNLGDFSVDQTGAFWICTTAGTVGSGCVFTEVYPGTGLTNPMSALGDTIYGGSSGSPSRLAGNTSVAPKVLSQTGNGSISAAPTWSLQNFSGMFGDGSDGSATLDGTATVTWASKASSTYTLTRDCFLTSLTINNGVTLNVSGYRIFCAGTVTNGGTIAANGINATSATGAGATASGTLQGGAAGGNGGTTTGTSGAFAGTAFGVGTSGTGGTGTSGNTGGGGHAASKDISPHRIPQMILTGAAAWNASVKAPSGACGGGGGGGDGTNSGGGGGGGGALVAILAYSVINNGTVSAVGGNGFTPTTGNCGGGGCGGGGNILVYTLSAWTAGTTAVTAGTEGSGVGTGTAGTGATSGSVLNVVLQ